MRHCVAPALNERIGVKWHSNGWVRQHAIIPAAVSGGMLQ